MANRFLSNIRINDAYTFPASDGSNGQFIKTDGSGNLSFADPSASSSASVIYRDNFTGDGSTVVFDLQNSLTTEDQSFIYIDGVYQEKDTYSLSSTQITFTTAPISGHSIEVISIAGINTGPTVIYQDNFTGNGSSTDFTLAQVIDNEVKTFVFLNGVYQFKGTYAVDSTTLSFDTAPANGVAIEVVSIASAVQSDSLQAGAVIIPVKNTHTASIAKGEPVYITGNVGASERLQIAPADASNSAKMPAAGLLLQTLAVNEEGYVITGGYLRNITTDTIDGTSTISNDTVYVKSGGGLTMTKPTGSNLIQNIAKVARSASGSSGSLLVSSILRTNDVPNLTTGKIWVGDGNTVESTVVHLDESNQRLGIGTSSPAQKLHIASGHIRIDSGYALLWDDSHERIEQSDGHLEFFINNGQAMTLNTNGLGIGTTSPNAKLDILGASSDQLRLRTAESEEYKIGRNSSTGLLEFYGTQSGYTGYVFGGVNGTRLTIDSSGRVGIGGEPASDSVLTVRGADTNNKYIRTINNNGTAYFGTIADGTGVIESNTSLKFTTGSSFTERMRITSGGNVNISTSGAQLFFADNGEIRCNDAFHRIRFRRSENILEFVEYGDIIFTTGSTTTERMRITSGGNVAIGETGARNARLLLNNTGSSGQPQLMLIDSGDSSKQSEIRFDSGTLYFEYWSGSSRSERMRIDSSGNTTFAGTINSDNITVGKTDGNNSSISLTANTGNWTFTNVQASRNLEISDSDGTGTVMTIDTSGRVGIGTTSPQRKLDVGGTVLIANAGNVNKGTLALGVQSSGSNKWSTITGAHYNAASGSGNGAGSAGIMMIGTHAQNGENDVIIGGSIYEANAATSIQFWTHTTNTSTAGGTRRMIITSNGSVGMGSVAFTPSTGLHLYYQNSADMGSVLTLGNNGCCVSNRTGVGFLDGSYYRSGIVFETSGTDGYSGHIIFKKSTNSTTLDGTSETMRIHSNGNVGIGTTSPTRKLDIAGEITHEGLVPKAGAFVDGLVTINKTVSISANTWASLDISLSDIGGSGTFAVQVYSNAHGSTGGAWYSMYWSGIMSWYHSSTNDDDIDEIPLHMAGHARNNNTLELRTKLHTADGSSYANRCELQIKTANALSSAPISFRFRKLL